MGIAPVQGVHPWCTTGATSAVDYEFNRYALTKQSQIAAKIAWFCIVEIGLSERHERLLFLRKMLSVS